MKKSRSIQKFYDNQKRLHREDGPSVIMPNGTKKWYHHGVLHRIDGPALEFANGSKHWYQNGKRHRENGPALHFANGRQEWWINGYNHRTDGPAIIVKQTNQYCGQQQWSQNGYLHRIDGPAFIETDNDRIVRVEWYVNGEKIDTPIGWCATVKLIDRLKREDHADRYL